ncbi:ABC transporter permease [Aquamicrobium segne]|uniref:ABC transporter permease n=1 Tax=Aquamicrobium segne TaxID=469547 RepID=A0ABW0H288_9HYPH
MRGTLSWQIMLVALAVLAGIIAHMTAANGGPANIGTALGLLAVSAAAAWALNRQALAKACILFIGAHGTAWLLLSGVSGHEGQAGASFYLALGAAWLLAWRCVTVLSLMKPVSLVARRALGLIIPLIFGAWVLILWEAIVRGAGIPFLLLPPPSAIADRIAASSSVLAADFKQTVLKAVLAGYVMGCGAGFVAAIAADRFVFLRRGLLPIGNMAAALPIIGVAPIMVMWFGFDWPSKAAVVVIMTFFPMLVNTVAGLSASGHMERDLMRTYASGYWPTLFKLRLPAAMPFIFNALKINSTLALIGAIVAEFFGTPVVGMGFRISTEVGRMNIDMVWAEITMAALAGTLFYGALALVERTVTFWHPSIRGG